MSVLDFIREDLRGLKPYSSARLEAGQAAVMLNANESPYAADAAQPLNRYPDPQPPKLLAALAALWGVSPAQVFVGRGSDEAIDLLMRGYCQAGRDAVLITPPTFGMYRVAATLQGARIVEAPLVAARDFALDVEAVLARLAADPAIKLVFLCSPNNPTGGVISRIDLERILAATAGRALVVVDEAYGDYVDQPLALPLLGQVPHLAVLKTLSKAHGLAAARVGALLGDPALIGFVRKLMAPYPVPAPVEAAALAALAEAPALLPARIAEARSERARLAEALARMPGVARVWPSQANFVCFRVADAPRTHRALLAAGVLVRDVSAQPNLAGGLRVSVGTPAENSRFLSALSIVLSAPQEAA